MKNAVVWIVFAVIFAIAQSGCTYTGAVRTGIAPMTISDRTYNGDVALRIDPAINSAEVVTNVGVHTVKVSAGNALNSAIVEAARVVFPRVAPQSSIPALNTYDFLVQVRLQNIGGNSTIDEGFWSSRANITTQISVVVELLNKDGSIAYRQVVTGTGIESRSVGTVNKVREGVEVALERSVQQVADGVSTALITGLSHVHMK